MLRARSSAVAFALALGAATCAETAPPGVKVPAPNAQPIAGPHGWRSLHIVRGGQWWLQRKPRQRV